jgi:protein SCO1/2
MRAKRYHPAFSGKGHRRESGRSDVEHRTGKALGGAVTAVLALVATALLTGCQVESSDSRAAGQRAAETGYRGSLVLEDPDPRPDFTLTDTEGRPYNFLAETKGKVALLFFGYTYCPDVCPVHMAGIAAVLRDFPYDLRQQFEVVFVSVDPERDTPERMREWLDNFDRGFVGLRGDTAEISRIQLEVYLPPAVRLDQPGSTARDGVEDYTVGHATQVIAFAADDAVRVIYPFGTKQADWAHDLPKLAGMEAGAPGAAAGPADRGAEANAAEAVPSVLGPVIPVPPTPDMTALYLTIRGGAEDDALVGVHVDGAHMAEIHRTVIEDGLSRMEPTGPIEIPAGGEVVFEPGGYHVMVHGPGALAEGDSVTITLTFRRAGEVSAVARVITYADLER